MGNALCQVLQRKDHKDVILARKKCTRWVRTRHKQTQIQFCNEVIERSTECCEAPDMQNYPQPGALSDAQVGVSPQLRLTE